MRLLVDRQLPVALARFPSERGLVCHHVSDFGIEAHDDRAIWRFARQDNLAIMTKDRDFSLWSPCYRT